MLTCTQSLADHVSEVEANSFFSYYDLIHPTFSLLHDDKKILTESLTDASEDIQMYFTKTLHQLVAIMSTTVLNVHDHQHLSTNVKAMISDKEVCRRPFDKLVMVQIMIFLFFSEEMMAFKVSGVNVWLGKAIQLAQAEKFNDRGNRLHKWTTKVWLSLVVIDQIHASRHNVEKQIVLKGKVLHGSDRKMLGEGGFALVRK